MPAPSISREVRGSSAAFSLAGKFDGPAAWELASRLSREPLGDVVLDFSRVGEFVDYAVAIVANVLLGLTGKTFHVRGLRQHQERVFKYFGVDVAERLGRTAALRSPVLARFEPAAREVA